MHDISTEKVFPHVTNLLSGQRLDKDLHTSTETQDEVESRLLLDVVVRESATVLELLSRKNKTLLIRWNALLILNLGLDVVDGIGWFYIQSNGFTSEGLYEDCRFERAR